jgi:hypothetical protein
LELPFPTGINADVAKRLPMWVQKNLVSLKLKKVGKSVRYTAELYSCSWDVESYGNVFFEAYSLEELRRQFNVYRNGAYRLGFDYMTFR